MATDFLWAAGTTGGLVTTAFAVVTTEIEGLTNNSITVSSNTFTNGSASQGMWADIFYYVGNPSITAALSAGANVAGWFLTSLDGGATFETSPVTATRPPDFIVPCPSITVTAGNLFKSTGSVFIPALTYKVAIGNYTGQTLASGATTAPYVKIAPVAMQY